MKSFMLRAALPAVSLLICLHVAAATVRDSFDCNGVKISYTIDGSGEPVVLIHGLGSSGDLNWRAPGTVDLLARHFQVITLDLRGHGRSGKPQTAAAYGPEMVEDITRLLDHLQIVSAHIAGYSLGGIIALDFVNLHPQRARSLTLGGMGCLLQGTALQAIWANMQRRNTTSMALCMRSVSELALTRAAIESIKTPTEVIVGDRDPVEKLYVEPLRKIRPDWPVKFVAGAGHINCIGKPQFKDELERWLIRQDPDPYAALRLYDGSWESTAPGSEKKDLLTDRCASFTGYFVCEQTVNGKTGALLVFVPAGAPGEFHTQNVLPDGFSTGRGDLRIEVNRWTYSSKYEENGKTTFYRTINVFTGNDRIHSESAKSSDGEQWTTTRTGDLARTRGGR